MYVGETETVSLIPIETKQNNLMLDKFYKHFVPS
jgi:hypothetical protein